MLTRKKWDGRGMVDPTASLKQVEQLFERHFEQYGYRTSLKAFIVDHLHERLPPDRQVLSALAGYETCLAELLPTSMPTNYRLHDGFKIALHRGRFYAVPRSKRDFSIVEGTVVPNFGGDTPVPETQISYYRWNVDQLVAAAKARVDGIPVIRSIARLGWRMIRRLMREFHVPRPAIPDVFSDPDLRSLLRRIDSPESSSKSAFTR